MTIGASQAPPKEEHPVIAHMQTETEDELKVAEESKPEIPVTPETQAPPVMDESQQVRQELLKMMKSAPTQAPSPQKEATSPPSEPTPVKVSVVDLDNPSLQDFGRTGSKQLTDNEDKKAEVDSEPVSAPASPPAIASSSSVDEASPRLEVKAKDDERFSKRVKEIDTLGASGVLLDILDDTALARQNEQKKEALEAAKEVMDDLHFESGNNSNTSEGAQNAR